MSAHITPAQIRGARAMLCWAMVDLARAAEVSASTVKRMERGHTAVLSDGIRSTVQRSLEAAGVVFLDDDGSGAGLRLKAP